MQLEMKLKQGNILEIHWGDGSQEVFRHHDNEKICRAAHCYKCQESKYQVELFSADPGILEIFIARNGKLLTYNAVLEVCPNLNFVQLSHTDKVSFKGCQNLETLVLQEYTGKSLDVSEIPKLRNLICRFNKNIKRLDLTQNNALEKLEISMCQELKKVSISDSSQLKVISLDDFTRLNSRCLAHIKKCMILKGGYIMDEWLHTSDIIEGYFPKEDRFDIDEKLQFAIQRLRYASFCRCGDEKYAEDYLGEVYHKYIVPLRKLAHDGKLPAKTHRLFTKLFKAARTELDWGVPWPPLTRLERLNREIENAKSHIISLNDEIKKTEKQIMRLSREIRQLKEHPEYGTDIRFDA